MGNNRSRVAPSRTLRILDSETRARFKNQREGVQLRIRLQDIQSKHKEALSRLVLEQHEIKAQLREYKYEAEQRKFFESFEQKTLEEETKENGKHSSRLLFTPRGVRDAQTRASFCVVVTMQLSLNGLSDDSLSFR